MSFLIVNYKNVVYLKMLINYCHRRLPENFIKDQLVFPTNIIKINDPENTEIFLRNFTIYLRIPDF